MSPTLLRAPNNAVSNPITIAISNPTATATVHATTIVAPLQFIFTLPTTVTTTAVTTTAITISSSMETLTHRLPTATLQQV